MDPPITPWNIKPHPVTKWNEYCQKRKIDQQVEVNDGDWNVTGEVTIILGQKVVGRAKYHNKTTAKNRAAEQAYRYMTRDLAYQESQSQSQNIMTTMYEFTGGLAQC